MLETARGTPDSGSPALTILTHSLTDLLGRSKISGTSGAPALLTSDLNGDPEQFRARYDVNEVFLNVHGNIRQAVIGGSLAGGHTRDTGELFATGNIGGVTIGIKVVGGNVFGSEFSGEFVADGRFQMTAGAGSDRKELSADSGDVTAREVTVP